MIIEEQERVLKNDKKNMLVSASAGSGKTYVVIKYITELICEKRVPVKDFVILTFTKAAASEMKERLQKSLREMGNDPFVIEQLDALSISNISTIHAFCEKMLKKYANLIGLNSNFVVADENLSQKIKNEAFENALNNFKNSHQDKYLNLMKFYKNDKSLLKKIMFEVEKLTDAVADKEEFLKKNFVESEKYFDNALSFLFQETKSEILRLLEEVERLHTGDFEFLLRNSLSQILASEDIFAFAEGAQEFKFPMLPKKKEVGEEVVETLNLIKKRIKKLFDDVKNLNLLDEDNTRTQKEASNEKDLLELFFGYEAEKERIKTLTNCLDFSDLEKYMKTLSEKENLFDGVKFVFVDEYQDTNKIQERIIKNVAKNSNFVAVGDVKQGIYGFRLASCEIFLKDMQEFEEDENSVVNNLKSNFRSSQKVLDFVNDVFKVCMTEETAGVDYLQTSMLEGKKEFKKENAKPINIDLVIEDKPEQKELPEIYSVKKDEEIFENSNKKQLFAIKNRIMEVMKSEICEDGNFRKCKFSDIAILFRSRGELFDDLESFLLESGIPVLSNSRSELFDEVEARVLLNWLKLALNFDDDVAMLSILHSALVGFSLEDISAIVQKSDEKLCEIVKNNQFFAKFIQLMNDFKMNFEIFGARVALVKLFEKTEYRAYINSQKNQRKLNNFIDKFLQSITESGFEFDLAGLINYFESVEITVVSDVSGNEEAITLTTIHNSKGLEYPIVFLAGCDRNLKKSARNGLVEINEDFGFSAKKYDTENNQEILSVRMKAIQKAEEKKDFVEELMIFYVALTRAKNRLYLFGRFDENIFKRFSVQDCDSYFDLIFFAKKDLREKLSNSDFFETEDIQVALIDELSEIPEEIEVQKENLESLPEVERKIREYLDFKYKFDDKLNFKLKESVTSLNKRQLEDFLEPYSNDNFKFGGATVDEGNAYHLALKVLDFEKIENMSDLERKISMNVSQLEDSLKFLDFDVLLKNIKILKDLYGNGIVYKEKQFIMKESLCKLLENVPYKDKILVQGVVDFFAVEKGEIILVDYKYSQSSSEEYLANKYKNQLKLYKMALESGLNLPVRRAYLLSLKYGKLIQIDI